MTVYWKTLVSGRRREVEIAVIIVPAIETTDQWMYIKETILVMRCPYKEDEGKEPERKKGKGCLGLNRRAMRGRRAEGKEALETVRVNCWGRKEKKSLKTEEQGTGDELMRRRGYEAAVRREE